MLEPSWLYNDPIARRQAGAETRKGHLDTKSLIFDWNGTLFGLADDADQNKALARAVGSDLARSIARGRVWRVPALLALLRTRRKLRSQLDEHQAGNRDNSHFIWSLLFLELWHKQFKDETH